MDERRDRNSPGDGTQPHGNPNPYAPPDADLNEPAPEQPDPRDAAGAREVRREHLNHEQTFRALGLVCMGSVALGTLAILWSGVSQPSTLLASVASAAIFCSIPFAIGLGLWRLRPWSRGVAILLVGLWLLVNLGSMLLGFAVLPRLNPAVGLLGLVLASALPAALLRMLTSARGRAVFRPEYAGVIAATKLHGFRSGRLFRLVAAVGLGGLTMLSFAILVAVCSSGGL